MLLQLLLVRKARTAIAILQILVPRALMALLKKWADG